MMLNIEEPRALPRFALFNLGFRPFFLGAAGFAAVAMLIWMAIYVFGWSVQPYGLPPMNWHAHEMIFGYALAVVAGFLLTAIRNWTGHQTVNGLPLFLLFLLWLTGRVVPFFSDVIALAYVAIIDNLFLVLLIVATVMPIVKARQWKNLGLVSKLVLLLASNLLFYAGVLGLLANGVYQGLYSGLYLILALIFVMGRRVIPFFIERGVEPPVQVRNWQWLDVSSLVLFLMFWIADVFVRELWLVTVLAAVLLVLHGVRLAGWYTHGIWQKPLLWSLYLAYASLVAGFALKAAVPLFDVSPYLAVHAFAVGGIGMMTIAMMARVALGHTGRDVDAPPAVVGGVFVMLLGGVLARVVVPLVEQAHYVLWIGVSQVLWITAFAMFLYVYLPMLLKPRVDGRPG
ncbi:MAG: NnrS family protein [Granulosicoccaceae bacterium]|jgi:uncharacterized protein involved in response to NO